MVEKVRDGFSEVTLKVPILLEDNIITHVMVEDRVSKLARNDRVVVKDITVRDEEAFAGSVSITNLSDNRYFFPESRVKFRTDEINTHLSVLRKVKEEVKRDVDLRVERELAQERAAVAERSERLGNLETELKRKLENLERQKESLSEKRKNVYSEVQQQVTRELEQERAQLEQGARELDELRNRVKQEQSFLASEREKFDKLKGFVGADLLDLVRNTRQDQPKSLPMTALPVDYIGAVTRSLVDQGYRVDAKVVRRFFCATVAAVALGQLVILSGPTGSGKTSLIDKLASVFGAVHTTIPVRPAWLDASDLLGFYDFNEQCFQPTVFTECLVAAKRAAAANRLYFLNLDELNLGRIENYASDLLALLEASRVGDKARLLLYANKYQDQMLNKLKQLESCRNRSDDVTEQRKTLLSHLEDYPAQLCLPENLVLCGTMNFDDAGYRLSPKVLDRALLLQMPQAELPNVLSHPQVIHDAPALPTLGLQAALDLASEPSENAQGAWVEIKSWHKQFLRPLGAHMSHRAHRVFDVYVGLSGVLSATPIDQVVSDFMATKVLPTVDFHADDETGDGESKTDLLQRWGDSLEAFPDLQADVNDMLQHKVNGRVQYLRS